MAGGGVRPGARDGRPGPSEVARIQRAVRPGTEVEESLAALTSLRLLRSELDVWEAQLITGARDAGASWATIAPALGVASRQAAERRFLRLQPQASEQQGTTRDDRVQAVRDSRAESRAVGRWARANGADLRQLAGQITALPDLAPGARTSVGRLLAALAEDDPAALLAPLGATHRHLPAQHRALAERVEGVTTQTERVRRESRAGRRGTRGA